MEDFEIIAGALMRGEVRDRLEEMRWNKKQIEWIEQKRFIESKFLIRGEPAVVETLRNWCKAESARMRARREP